MLERKPLEGKVIAVPETRELERLADLLEQQGATTLRVPLVTTLDTPDRGSVVAWLQELVRGEFDYLILLTGEGIYRLLAFAERAGLLAEFRKSLGRVRTVTRGHKASRALGEVGLLPSVSAETPTTDGVIDALRDESLEGCTVGVQLYGQEPNRPLERFLDKAGARVRKVAPYVYVRDVDDDKVLQLIEQLAEGAADAIAFTCSTQVDRLFEVARTRNVEALLHRGLQRTRIAAVGPITAMSLRRRGFRIDIVPRSSFFMRSLVNEVVAALRNSAPGLRQNKLSSG